jgi:hypothetical protein
VRPTNLERALSLLPIEDNGRRLGSPADPVEVAPVLREMVDEGVVVRGPALTFLRGHPLGEGDLDVEPVDRRT